MGGMRMNKWKLNPDKTEILLVTPVLRPGNVVQPLWDGVVLPLKLQARS